MVLNGLFDSLRLNANVTLRGGCTAVLQKPLDKGDVIAICLVDLRGIPLAETVSADTLKAQVVADQFQLLLDGSFRDGEYQIPATDTVPQTVVLNILCDDERNREYSPLPGLLLHNL